MKPFFRRYDPEDVKLTNNPMIYTSENELQYWNDQFYGIFQTIHEMDGRGRKESNCIHITSWPTDIDDGSKEDQLRSLLSLPILPSLVIETRRGFQPKWSAIDATRERFKLIAKNLCRIVNGDPTSCDLARVHRVPGFKHWKQPKDPFTIIEVARNDGRYTEEQMLYYFPLPAVIERKPDNRMRECASDTFWGRVGEIDCEQALIQLSGHPSCGAETFDFMPVWNGNLNIVVNGEGTACWVDRNKKIGSHSNGGPTIANWLHWYGNSWAEVARIIKEVFKIS